MNQIVISAALILLAAFIAPKFLNRQSPDQHAHVDAGSTASKGPKTAVGYRNVGGQFNFNSSMNGLNVKVLVDTGASSVTINRTTAQRIGININDSDFRHFAETANGRVPYARATINEIRINGILVRNVSAAVLKDESLKTALLGMTFLNRLKKFEFNGNQLNLIQ